MEKNNLDFKSVFETILKTIRKNANILADSYLIKDASIISKWKNNKLIPKNDDILKIIDFTMSESSIAQRKIIRNKIEALILSSSIEEDIKDYLLDIEDFHGFLLETLNLITTQSENGESPECKLTESELFNGIDKKLEREPKAASEDSLQGRYSGIVEFNMILSNDRSKNQEDKNVKLNLSNNIKTKNSHIRVKRNLGGKAILSMIIVVVVSSWISVSVFMHSMNHSYNNSNEKDLKVYGAKESSSPAIAVTKPEAAGSTAITTSAPVTAQTSQKKDNTQVKQDTQSGSDSKPSALQSSGSQDNKVKKESGSKPNSVKEIKNKENNHEENQIKNVSSSSITANSQNTNISNSNISNSNITINNSSVNGNNVVSANGSNISVNIEK